MALYHFHANLIRRSKVQSVIAAAAYRAGEKLCCDYYSNKADYTRKKGVVLTDTLLPPLALKAYADRKALWILANPLCWFQYTVYSRKVVNITDSLITGTASTDKQTFSLCVGLDKGTALISLT